MSENLGNSNNSQQYNISKEQESERDNGTQEKSLLGRMTIFLNFSWISYITTLIVFTIPFVLLIFSITIFDPLQQISLTIIYWIIISLLYFLALLISTLANRIWQRKTIENDISNLYEKLEDDNFFTTLIRINFKYIDKYYLQTQVQANKSFYISTIAAIVSLIMIIVGIVLLYFGSTDNKIQSAYITIVAGALGEFIATVFFYLYNRTVLEMSSYHQKLVLTQNVSLALRIADELQDEEAKSKAQTMLIESLSKDINMYLTMQVSKALQGGADGTNKP